MTADPLRELELYVADDSGGPVPGPPGLNRRSGSRDGRLLAIGLVAFALLVGATSGLLLREWRGSSTSATDPARTVPASAPSRSTVLSTFPGHIAVWSGGQLEVINGATGEVQTFAADGVADAAWSHDGSFLAYTRHEGGAAELWLRSVDQGAAARVEGLPAGPNISFQWSPTEGRLAVAVEAAPGLQIVEVAPRPRVDKTAVPDELVTSFHWAPAGSLIAFTATLPGTAPDQRSDGLYTWIPEGGDPQEHLRTPGSGLFVVQWWPDGQGIVLYRIPQYSWSLAADGLPAETFELGTGGMVDITVGLVQEPRAIQDGRLVFRSGTGRAPWEQRGLALCDRERCVSVIDDSERAVLETSAAGDVVAFVQAPARELVGFESDRALAEWLDQRTLSVVDVRTLGIMNLGTRGLYAPSISEDGISLLVAAGEEIVFVDLADMSERAVLHVELGDPEPTLDGPIAYAWSEARPH